MRGGMQAIMRDRIKHAPLIYIYIYICKRAQVQRYIFDARGRCTRGRSPLELSWRTLGLSWRALGALLVLSWVLLGLCWPFRAPVEPPFGHFGSQKGLKISEFGDGRCG